MEILELDKCNKHINVFESDSNGREINIYKLSNVIPTGESLLYPNPLFYSSDESVLYRPINENIMSLKAVNKTNNFDITDITYKKTVDNPVFFFIYNTDNYFHFVYDTLPYLISYFELKKTIPNLKLLVNYPNSSMTRFYRFVNDTLFILNIDETDLIFIDNETLYNNVYVSSSYTHGVDSNLPPRAEIHDLYKFMVDRVKYDYQTPKNIYISRRSWVHGNTSNIGTNYTDRRKMEVEDELVDLLTKKGYVEVFGESLSMLEKIHLFSNAEKIMGPIGGGLCNVLFSKKECELIAIVSPEFLNVNERFTFSLNNVNFTLFNDVRHTEKSDFKSFMRVKVGSIIGEITEVYEDSVKIAYNDTSIAGWNSETKYKTITVPMKDCVKLDNGLNSPWTFDIENFKNKFLWTR